MIFPSLFILGSGFVLVTFATVHAVTPRLRNLFYGWKLVGLTLLVTGLISGPIWNGVGVWVNALEIHFGWSRTQLTGAFSLTQLEGSIVGPFIGYLIDRQGPRRMIFLGLMVTGFGFIVFSRTTNLPMFYFAYTLIMLGTMSGTWLPLMAMLNRWFNRKRATAMAIAGEGDFIGAFLMVPAMAWSVAPGHLGWSATALWIGVVFMAVAWPISRFVRDRPEDLGQRADGDPPIDLQQGRGAVDHGPGRNMPDRDQPDFTARQSIRTSAFWFITFGHGLSSMLFVTLTVHLIPLLTDQGLSLQTAAYIWSVMMVAGAVFQPIGGYVGDRIPINVAAFAFTILQTVGFFLVVFVNNVPMAVLFAVIYGAGFGGRVPLTTAIPGEYFGRKAFATISGIGMAPRWVLMLAAPLFAATMFDARGDYTFAFLILGFFGAMGGVLFLFAKKPRLEDSARGFVPVKGQV